MSTPRKPPGAHDAPKWYAITDSDGDRPEAVERRLVPEAVPGSAPRHVGRPRVVGGVVGVGEGLHPSSRSTSATGAAGAPRVRDGAWRGP